MYARAVAVAFLLAGPALAGDPKSWTGRAVILAEHVQIVNGTTDARGRLVFVAGLSRLQYDVEDEEGEFIKVRENGVPGWFPKAKAVPAEEAVPYFTEAIRKNPAVTENYNRRGEAYYFKGDYDAAVADYTEALILSPDTYVYLNNRGRAYAGKKDFDRAIKDCSEALRRAPGYAFGYGVRGTAYAGKKDYEKAVKDYEEALRLLPNYVHVHGRLARVRATCPDAKFRDGEAAVESAKRACELSAWKSGFYLDALAAAYAEAGKFDEAVEWQKKALEDRETVKRFGAGMRDRLKLYEAGKPYRDAGGGA
jgi:tetratricopeptide (TPR) repeat protein